MRAVQQPSESKTCAACGRPFSWRRKWAEHWSEVKFCSRRCRGLKVRRVDREIETLLLTALRSESSPASIDPAKTIRAQRSDLPDVQSSIERIHRAVRRLAERGDIELILHNRLISPGELRAGVRIRPPRRSR